MSIYYQLSHRITQLALDLHLTLCYFSSKFNQIISTHIELCRNNLFQGYDYM